MLLSEFTAGGGGADDLTQRERHGKDTQTHRDMGETHVHTYMQRDVEREIDAYRQRGRDMGEKKGERKREERDVLMHMWRPFYF